MTKKRELKYKYFTKEILEEIKNHQDYYWNEKDGQYKYIGILGRNTKYKIHWLAEKAYYSLCCQRSRCNNPNDDSYIYYGGKCPPIKCNYSSTIDFINWWINEFLKRDKWETPCTSRFDDKGDYQLDNIELIEKGENSSKIKCTDKQRNAARINGLKTSKKCILINIINKNDKIIFDSAIKGSCFLNRNKNYLTNAIRKLHKIKYNNKIYRCFYLENFYNLNQNELNKKINYNKICKKIKYYNKNNNEILIFNSIKECAKYLNIRSTSVTRIIKLKRFKNFIIEYVKD